MFDLPYLVEVKWPQHVRWETIAAFDCQPPAESYRDRCFSPQKRELGFEYRVRFVPTREE